MPFEIHPDDSDRGFYVKQINRERNRETGTYTFTVHGYTPAPTPTDGYHITATVELGAEGGPAVTRLLIEPSDTILEADRHRMRQPDENHLSPVNTSVLTLIKFTAIINRIAEVEEIYAEAIAADPKATAAERELLANLKRRQPRRDDAKHARHAEEALAAIGDGRDFNSRLKHQWMLSPDGVKKRISRLRERKWLTGRAAGPALTAWRNQQAFKNTQEENN
jgi:hypothetical protein